MSVISKKRLADSAVMKILFLDQSGQLGGAELYLADFAQHHLNKDSLDRGSSLVGVFADGVFPDRLRQLNIPVKVLTKQTLRIQKASGLLAGIKSLGQLSPLVAAVARLSKDYDLIYANTQKALVVGAIASFCSRRPFVYHLHDIVSPEHFSAINRRIIVTLANRAALVIANSQSSRDAFVQAGGKADRLHVVYNGFHLKTYADCIDNVGEERKKALRSELAPVKASIENNQDSFVVGHFSRLSPWKGQHVLVEALQYCPDEVTAVFVGDALFGEQDYVQQLHQQIKNLKLEHRVKFLGFRSDVPQLMIACDLIAHTSIAPEPFGRVIVEAMLCGRPIIAAAAGGALEILDRNQTGWLTSPGNAAELANTIMSIYRNSKLTEKIAKQGQAAARQRFNTEAINAQIDLLIKSISQKQKPDLENRRTLPVSTD